MTFTDIIKIEIRRMACFQIRKLQEYETFILNILG